MEMQMHSINALRRRDSWKLMSPVFIFNLQNINSHSLNCHGNALNIISMT